MNEAYRLLNNMNRPIRNNNKGFTLIELTIYSGLLGILLVILSEFFVTIMNLQLKLTSTSTIEQDGQYILARSTYDVRRASTIQSPLVGATGASFTMTVNEDGTDKTYQYDVQNENLTLTIDTQSTQLNSDKLVVSDFSVSRIGNSGSIAGAKDSLQLLFSLAPKATPSGGSSTEQFGTTISLR